MAEEIQEEVKIIRVAYDGIEIAMKVGSGGIAAMQKAIDFLKGMLDYEKSLGKTSMRKLILKGGDLQVLQFNTEDMKKVEKMAKKYGILYSVLPDCNRKDGLSEVIFHTEAVPRVNMMIRCPSGGSRPGRRRCAGRRPSRRPRPALKSGCGWGWAASCWPASTSSAASR